MNSGGTSDGFEGVFEMVDEGFGWIAGPGFLVQFAGRAAASLPERQVGANQFRGELPGSAGNPPQPPTGTCRSGHLMG